MPQKGVKRKLKDLVKIYLKSTIQEDCHSSLVDARAAMALFMAKREYLESRVVKYDPRIAELPSTRSRRGRGSKFNQQCMENLNPNFMSSKVPLLHLNHTKLNYQPTLMQGDWDVQF